jgi:hypothetical protein
VLGGKVLSTVFSMRRGIVPAGSFVCISFVPPIVAGSKYELQFDLACGAGFDYALRQLFSSLS